VERTYTKAICGYAERNCYGAAHPKLKGEQPNDRSRYHPHPVGYLLPVPAIVATIGWVLLLIGVVLLVLGQIGRPVGGRRYWY
jgi:Family of unknown function (DUF6131)